MGAVLAAQARAASLRLLASVPPLAISLNGPNQGSPPRHCTLAVFWAWPHRSAPSWSAARRRPQRSRWQETTEHEVDLRRLHGGIVWAVAVVSVPHCPICSRSAAKTGATSRRRTASAVASRTIRDRSWNDDTAYKVAAAGLHTRGRIPTATPARARPGGGEPRRESRFWQLCCHRFDLDPNRAISLKLCRNGRDLQQSRETCRRSLQCGSASGRQSQTRWHSNRLRNGSELGPFFGCSVVGRTERWKSSGQLNTGEVRVW